MAWLLRKKKDVSEDTDDGVSEEVQEYFDSERKERAGVAWALAFFSLVLTLAIAAGAFFGGRAVYRRVVKNENKTVGVQQAPAALPEAPTAPAAPSSPEPTPPANPPSNPQTATPSPSPSTTPTTGSSEAVAGASTDLPNTGPGNLAVIFVATSVVSGLAYHLVTRRQTN